MHQLTRAPGLTLAPLQVRELVEEIGDPAAQGVDLMGQFDDPLDAGEVDAFFLTEALNLAQERHVA